MRRGRIAPSPASGGAQAVAGAAKRQIAAGAVAVVQKRSKLPIESPRIGDKAESQLGVSSTRVVPSVDEKTFHAESDSDRIFFEVQDKDGVRRVAVPIANAQKFLEKNQASIIAYPPFLKCPGR